MRHSLRGSVAGGEETGVGAGKTVLHAVEQHWVKLLPVVTGMHPKERR